MQGRVLSRVEIDRSSYSFDSRLYHNWSITQVTRPKLELLGQYQGKYINFKRTQIKLKPSFDHLFATNSYTSYWRVGEFLTNSDRQSSYLPKLDSQHLKDIHISSSRKKIFDLTSRCLSWFLPGAIGNIDPSHDKIIFCLTSRTTQVFTSAPQITKIET